MVPKSHGDEFLSRLRKGEAGGGELENSLLHELQEGRFPIDRLRLLLEDENEKVIAAGMWIASELGAVARSLFDDISRLLHHPSFQVRFFALDYLLSCARPEDEQAIVSGLDLVDDPNSSVRWKALVFLATAPEALLRAGHRALSLDEARSAHRRGMELLLSAVGTRDSSIVSSGLVSGEVLLGRYAAAAAARMIHSDPTPLKEARGSADPTIKQFAVDMAARTGVAAPS